MAVHPADSEAVPLTETSDSTKALISPQTALEARLRLKNFCLALLYFVLLELYGIFLFAFGVFSNVFYSGRQGTEAQPQGTQGSQTSQTPQKCHLLFTTAKMSKTLHLIRHIKWCFPQFELFTCDAFAWHMCRFSKCVSKGFVVPYASSTNFDAYKAAILKIVDTYDIDVIVPGSSIEEAKHLARLKDILKQQGHKCKILTSGLEKVATLDDKDRFYNLLVQSANNRNDKKISLDVAEGQKLVSKYFEGDLGRFVKLPVSRKVTDRAALLAFLRRERLIGAHSAEDTSNTKFRYILKRINISTNRKESIIRLPCSEELFESVVSRVEVSEDEPWLLCQFIYGHDYCICVGCVEGDTLFKVSSVCCDYCVNYRDYRYGNKDKLEAWIENFVKVERLTGIICFDFRVAPDGAIYVFEANPRPHSCICIINGEGRLIGDVVQRFIASEGNGCDTSDGSEAESEAGAEAVEAVEALDGSKGSGHVFWLFHELVRWMGVRDMHPEMKEKQLLWQGFDKTKNLVYVDDKGFVCFNIENVLVGRDAVLNVYDPWPVLVSHCVHMPYLLWQNVWDYKCVGWSTFDLCILKLTKNNFVA